MHYRQESCRWVRSHRNSHAPLGVSKCQCKKREYSLQRHIKIYVMHSTRARLRNFFVQSLSFSLSFLSRNVGFLWVAALKSERVYYTKQFSSLWIIMTLTKKILFYLCTRIHYWKIICWSRLWCARIWNEISCVSF